MACCGQSRQAYAAAARPVQYTSGTPIFEYVGVTSLTVTGPATGRTYRFERSGARVEIDSRDLQSLGRVPNLRRVAIHR